MSNTMILFALPQEILCSIFSYLRPADIIHVGQTCRAARDFIVPQNKLLWQSAFLQVFDNPQYAWADIPRSIRAEHIREVEESWDWYSQLKRRCLALKIISPPGVDTFSQEELPINEVVPILLEIIDTAKTRPTATEIASGTVPQIDDRSSLNIRLLTSTFTTWDRLENLIHDSHTSLSERQLESSCFQYARPVTRSMASRRWQDSRTEAQKRLHVLYGRTAREKLEHGVKGYARRIVYDWSYPVPANDYGPFKSDGSGEVNWHVLEATMSVILRIFDMCVDGRVAMPPGFCYAIPHRTLADPTVPEDWARVSGRWMGTYSFLDYADLFQFNTTEDIGVTSTLEAVPEACGDLMRLDLKLDPSLADDPNLQSSLPSCTDLPPLHFSGEPSSIDPMRNPRIRVSYKGRVSLCPGGREVRWKYIINYRGHDQWQLEGVQPGGIRSGPIYGTWTQWGHGEHAPVGTFIYVQEELCKRQELVLSRRA